LSLPKESNKPKKSKKKIIIIIVSVILIGMFVISPIVSYITDPEYRKGLEELSESTTEQKPTYEELMIQEWNLRLLSCEKINSLDELQYFIDETDNIYKTLDYEIETYVKSESSMNKLVNQMEKVTECTTKKITEYDYDGSQIVELNIITCETASEQYFEIKASLTNNSVRLRDFHMVLYVQDINGKMLTFIEHTERNVLAGHTVYFDRLLKNYPEIDKCGIKFE